MSDQERKTILLLVEDEALIALAEKIALEKYGYQVITADSGENALEILEKNPGIDLVLMDIYLGNGIDGAETTRKILESRSLPVIFLSSHAESAVVERTEGIPAFGYILKNSGTAALVASIKMALRLFDAKRLVSKNEKALTPNEEKYRLLFETVTQGIVYQADDGRIISANPAAEKILGLSLNQMVGKTSMDSDWKTIREDGSELPGNEHPAMRALATGEVVGPSILGVYQPRKDSHSWLSVTAIPLFRPGERSPFQVYAIMEDITDRKKAEDALALERTFIDAIFNSVPGMLYLYDSEGLLVRWNRKHELMTGYSAAELSRMHLLDWYKGDEASLKAITEGINTTAVEGFGQAEANLQKKDGTTISMYFTASPLTIAGKRYFTGIGIDITRLKHVEETMKENEARLRTLSDNLPGGLLYQIDVGEDGRERRFTYISAGVEQLHGVTTSEVLNDAMAIYGQIVEENRQSLAESEAKAVDSMSVFSAEVRFLLPSGAERWGLFYSAPRRLPNRHIIWDGIEMDITDRKRAEEKVSALLLENELLLRETHHRIKNNMGVMYGLLSLQADSQEDDSCRGILTDAALRVQSMMVLYDKLYRTGNYRELSIRDFLPPLIDEIAQVFPSGPLVKMDIRIEDILLGEKILSPLGIIVNELITNSLKYAFTNASEGLITVSVSKKDNLVTMVYADNGVGIPETVTLENSTGFGMRLIAMLVQQIKGSVTIERGHGTKYVIEFPNP